MADQTTAGEIDIYALDAKRDELWKRVSALEEEKDELMAEISRLGKLICDDVNRRNRIDE